MAVKSVQLTAGATASIAFTATGSADVPQRVRILPESTKAIYIGGVDAQTFPVADTGVELTLVAGDVVYMKRNGGADVTVNILEQSV